MDVSPVSNDVFGFWASAGAKLSRSQSGSLKLSRGNQLS